MIIISDIHLGTQRQAGTTPATQQALKQYLRDEFKLLVERATGHLVVNGDMFDGFTVDPAEVISAYEVLTKHVANGAVLTLGMGNHDASAKGDKTSSFHLLAHILSAQFPAHVQVVDNTCGLTEIASKVWMVSHMTNQDLFDIEIDKACNAGVGKGFLLLHCNVMSPFAEKADHSLNLSEQQLDALTDAGWQIVVAHEHQMKSYQGGKCLIVGNQIPSSVSDCLNNKNNEKFYAKIEDGKVELVKWQSLVDVYTEVTWQDIGLRADLDNFKFIRVTGDCTSEQAADMVGRVSKLRQASTAFVVSNNVKIEGVAQMEGLAEMTAENITKFDVLGALLEELTEKEAEVVKELLK